MVPEDGVAVVAGTHNAVFGQPQAGEVGEVAMGHSGRPGNRTKNSLVRGIYKNTQNSDTDTLMRTYIRKKM